jgi:MFS transporter, Spinster family, sphingosine-1-phosphate transporter
MIESPGAEHTTVKSSERASGYAWLVFSIIFLLGFFDFAVRQMVVGMFPALKSEWLLDDKSLAILVAIVPIVVGVAVLPLSFVIDRWSRVKAIFLMAIIWSVATIICGLASQYMVLLVARGFVGFGEAAFGPAGFALLAYYFPARWRATVIGGVLIAATLGSMVGIYIGSALTELYGWRAAFICLGGISFVLSFSIFWVKDYQTQPIISSHRGDQKVKEVIKALLLSPTASLSYLAGALQMFIISTLTIWLPSYLNRYYDMPNNTAAFYGAVAIGLGAIGTLIWSRSADAWGHRNARGRLYVPAIGAVITGLLLAISFAILPFGIMQLIVIMAATFSMTASLGPVNAVVIDVIRPGLRASATAMVSVCSNLLGLAAGPLVIGAISDAYGLHYALGFLPLFSVLACLGFVAASRFYEKERDATLSNEQAVLAL